MPTYEYECPKCGHRFEKFQSMTDKPVRTCPRCKGRRVKRLIGSGVGIIFKGSGFYTTDYRGKSYREAAKKDTQSEPGGTKEAAPAAKAETKTGDKKTGGKKKTEGTS
jgi:putative FmdB family regulatory protein